MDVRRFFKKRKSDDNNQDTPGTSETHVEPAEQRRGGHHEQLPTTTNQMPPRIPLAKVANGLPHHLDIGSYVKITEHLTNNRRYDFLVNTYVPPTDYSYQNDTQGSRCFRHTWINQYSPWLAYSSHLKGALCKYCVLFLQPVHRGLMGAFIVTPFVKYKDFNECARKHMLSSWHKGALQDANNFLTTVQWPELTIMSQMDRAVNKAVTQNLEKLFPILSSILFCSSHDIDLLMKAFQDDADRVFSEDVIHEVKTLAEELGIYLTMPRR